MLIPCTSLDPLHLLLPFNFAFDFHQIKRIHQYLIDNQPAVEKLHRDLLAVTDTYDRAAAAWRTFQDTDVELVKLFSHEAVRKQLEPGEKFYLMYNHYFIGPNSLTWAAWEGNLEVMKILLQVDGIDVNNQGEVEGKYFIFLFSINVFE